MSRIVVVAIAASLFGGAALAQDTQQPTPQPAQQPQNPQSDPVAAVVGAWELSNADHDKTCRLNFRADATAGGYKIDVDKNCPTVFPSTKDITAWTVDNYGSLRLLNAQGEPVIELTEVESGMYDGFTPEEGRYVHAGRRGGGGPFRRRHDRRLGNRAQHRQADLHAHARQHRRGGRLR